MAAKKKSAVKNPGAAGDRHQALDAALKMIEKDYGQGAVMRLGDKSHQAISVISS